MKKHTPVLVREVLEGLQIRKGGRYIDATFGMGGHSDAIRQRGGIVLGIDVDPDTEAVHGNFRNIENIATQNGFEVVDGILFDLGVSSYQLDTPRRGFSYRFADAPLDMRFGDEMSATAADIVNTYSEEDLYEIIARYGEEQLAGTIAHAIVRARRLRPIQTTGDVVDSIAVVVKDAHQRSAVLSRVFQAFRIAVNDELGALKEGLSGAGNVLKHGGRLAVISFHSLEDRIAKQFFTKERWKSITKSPIRASEEERQSNIRARSAKLRIGEKI